MKRAGPIYRSILWCAILPAVAALAFLAITPAQGLAANLPFRYFVAAAIAFSVALLTASLGWRNMARRINRLRHFAESLVESTALLPNPIPEADDEIGALARALSRGAAEWRELLGRLEVESARREAILKSMAEGVLAVDHNLRVIFCNESVARLFGVQLPLPPRMPLVDLERDPNLTELIVQTLDLGFPRKQTLQLASADGRVFQVSVMPLVGSPQPGALAILYDVTDLERLERVRKDFVANVSHELRTPLTAIRGYAETLLDGALEDRANSRKFLEVILTHAIRLNNIASDLLVLSDLESGRNHPDPELISISAAIQCALRAVEPEARVRQVILVCGPLEECAVWGPRMRFEQALINLIDNAVKFNRPGGSVRVESTRDGDGHIHISVSDDGIGISSGDLSRIFERFYRVDKTRSREVGGTGLGLSIVKHVIDRMNGVVIVESQLGKGSTFKVTLPAHPPLTSEKINEPPQPPSPLAHAEEREP